MQQLAGKTAVITGAGSGIGRALARAFAAEGCRLALVDLDPAGLEETRRLLPGVPVSVHVADVADRARMAALPAEIEAQHGANFALRTKLNGDKATMTLRVNDPFGTQRFAVRAGDERVLQITERNFGARMYWLAFQYSYGRPPRVRQPTQDQQGQSQSGFVPPA